MLGAIGGVSRLVANAGIMGGNFGMAGHAMQAAGKGLQLAAPTVRRGAVVGGTLGAVSGAMKRDENGNAAGLKGAIMGAAAGAAGGAALGGANRLGLGKGLQWAGTKSRAAGTWMDGKFQKAMNWDAGGKLRWKTPLMVPTGNKVPVVKSMGANGDMVKMKREWKQFELTPGKALNIGGNALLIGEGLHALHQAKSQQAQAPAPQMPQAQLPQTKYPLGGVPNYDQQLKAAAARDFQQLLKYAEEHLNG